MKDRERDQEANVVDTAVQVLGAVAQCLDWPRYQELLGIFNRAMQRTEGKVIPMSTLGSMPQHNGARALSSRSTEVCTVVLRSRVSSLFS